MDLEKVLKDFPEQKEMMVQMAEARMADDSLRVLLKNLPVSSQEFLANLVDVQQDFR